MNYKIVKPSQSIRQEAEKVYSKSFMKLWESGEAPPRIKVEKLLQEQGLYDPDSIDKESENIRKELRNLELKLRKGRNSDGTRMTKAQGREVALSMSKLRAKATELTSSVSQYFNTTAESLASYEKLMFIVWSCVKREDGSPFWPTFEDYKSDVASEVAEKAMQEVLKTLSGISGDIEQQFYENVWLIKYGFMNQKYQLINNKGQLITQEGKVIDEEGHYIDENGGRVDYYGNPLTKDGELAVEDGWADEPSPSVSLES